MRQARREPQNRDARRTGDCQFEIAIALHDFERRLRAIGEEPLHMPRVTFSCDRETQRPVFAHEKRTPRNSSSC